jgi:hypothetical protein
MLLFSYGLLSLIKIGGKKMDNEDFGINQRPFQRYIPSCYGRYQRYIPSVYLIDENGTSDEDEDLFGELQVIEDITDYINRVAQF